MTTITLKHGKIAMDTQMSNCNTVATYQCKKYLLNVGGYDFVAITGTFVDLFKLEKFFVDNKDSTELPEFEESTLILVKDGKVFILECGMKFELWKNADFEGAAWGSGMDVAKGAMYAGFNAEEAVRAAIHYDFYTGGNVDIYDIEAKKIITNN